jgi:hypothetical protein
MEKAVAPELPNEFAFWLSMTITDTVVRTSRRRPMDVKNK